MSDKQQTVELAVNYRGLPLDKKQTYYLSITCSFTSVALLYLGLTQDSNYLLWILTLPIAFYLIRNKLLDRKFPRMFKNRMSLKSKIVSPENYYKGIQKITLDENGLFFPPCISKNPNGEKLKHDEILSVTRYYRSCTNEQGDYELKNFIFILDDSQKETRAIEFTSVYNKKYLIPSAACDTHPIELYIKHYGYNIKEKINKLEVWTVRAIMAPISIILFYGSFFSFIDKDWFTGGFLGTLATIFLFIIYRSLSK